MDRFLDSKLLHLKHASLHDAENRLWFVTGDAECLYNNIDTSQLIGFINDASLWGWSDEHRALMVYTFNVLLATNYMRYGERIFRQKFGFPMGTKPSPECANFYMSCLENKLRSTHRIAIARHVVVWKRYIDDIFLVMFGTRAEIQAILDAYNQLHPRIRINWTLSNEEAVFLDLRIYRGPRFAERAILDIAPYAKATSAFLYLPFNSYHTKHVFKGWIRAELLRLLRELVG